MNPLTLEKPIHFEVELVPPYLAQLGSDLPGVKRIGGRTLTCTGKEMWGITRILRLIPNAG